MKNHRDGVNAPPRFYFTDHHLDIPGIDIFEILPGNVGQMNDGIHGGRASVGHMETWEEPSHMKRYTGVKPRYPL